MHHCTHSALPLVRQTVLHALALWACCATSSVMSQTLVTQTSAHEWRAMSRVGYGPTPALLQEVQSAASPQAWALQQIELAFAASQHPPRIAPELKDFNAPLPQLFEWGQQERTARATQKREPDKENEATLARRFDFTGAQNPLHFSQRVMRQAAAWRLNSCSQPEEENPLLARMTEFWFNHLNIFNDKGAVRPFTGHYEVNVARAHALGKFEDLLLASAQHPAMLHYLDQVQSVAEGSRGPQGKVRGLNENYARELMELHTLGVDGGYTQNDVREMARILTGWTVGPSESQGYRFVQRQHDSGNKVVLGQKFPTHIQNSGQREGEDAIRMLARHPATATRISLRLAQFFVSDTPSTDLTHRLSRTFLATQGDISAVMRTLLASDDFWKADNHLFKTPLDFACSALAVTQGATDRRNLLLAYGFLANAGQPLQGWQTPDGYKFDAATWLVPEALTRRADLALTLARTSPPLSILTPYLSTASRDTVDQARPALRAGLALASPDFMYK